MPLRLTVLCLLCPVFANATGPVTSTNYTITAPNVVGGAGRAASPSYGLLSSTSQSGGIGHASSENYLAANGFIPIANRNAILEPDTFPSFEIGAIPTISVWADQTSTFRVLATPLGAGAIITIDANPYPGGAIGIDANHVFTYIPSADDASPFVVTFTGTVPGQSLSQDVTVKVMLPLPPEESVFGIPTTRPMPNPESRDYVVINTVVIDEPIYFNTQTRPNTRKISISGKTVVFQEGHANELYDTYNENDDIREMNIDAETLIIRDPLHLPQTNVTIHAKELRFEDSTPDSALIDTTPRSLTILPAQFVDGLSGHNGGNITVDVRTLAVPDASFRFILDGGNGQPGGLGRIGSDGASYPAVCCDWNGDDPTRCEGVEPFYHGVVIYMHWSGFRCSPLACGTMAWPGDGENAIAGGRPGNPANAGTFATAWAETTEFAHGMEGNAGAAAGHYDGGKGGTPKTALWFTCHCSLAYYCDDPPASHTSHDGAAAESPPADITVGRSVAISRITSELSWVRPGWLRLSLAYATDSYIVGHTAVAQSILTEYQRILNSYEGTAEWNELDDQTRNELSAISNQIASLLYRLANNLDYFGNPAGWTPMLSFEANLLVFTNEVDRAIRVMYLVYWLKNVTTTLEARVSALTTGRGQLRDEIEQFMADYEAANAEIPIIDAEAASIEVKTFKVQAELVVVEQRLLQQAQDNLRPRQPFWRRALRVLGTALKFVPVYQPALAAIGTGFTLIANVNADEPWQAVQGIGDAVQAFRGADFGASAENLRATFTGIRQTLNDINLGNIGDRIRQLRDRIKPIVEGIGGLKEAIGATQIDNAQLKAEFDRIKAEDPVYIQLVDEIAELMVEKKVFMDHLADLTQRLTRLANGIHEDVIAIDALNRDLSAMNQVLDARVEQYLDLMDRRARERLLKYHYYLAKAFEYRMLQPYPGDLDLTAMFDKMRLLADVQNSTELLSLQDFNALKVVYEEQLSTVAETILDLYEQNTPARRTGVRFSLLPKELSALNAGEPVIVNLKERGLINLNEDDVRVVEFEVKTISTSYIGPTPQSFAFVDLDFLHSGESRISRNGETFIFRHLTGATEFPIVWSSRYFPIDTEILNEPISPAEQSLLLALLSIGQTPPDSDTLLLFSQPGAWADVVVSKTEGTTDNGSDIRIDALELSVSYDYRARQPQRKLLEVKPSESTLLPFIAVSQADQTGRQDGRGAFRRVYPAGASVSLSAEPEYGDWKFDRWTDRFGNTLGSPGNPVYQLTMSSDRFVIADYVRRWSWLSLSMLSTCMSGPVPGDSHAECAFFDLNSDGRIDLQDFAVLQENFTGAY